MTTDTCFLSYARADDAFALRLTSDLRSLGVDIWVDQLRIRPSEHWDRAIERAIRGCRSVVAVLSPRSVASENVADEISLAIDCGKPVIPLMIERCALPLRLTRRHLIDATTGYELALKQCLAEIGGEQPRQAPAVSGAPLPVAVLDPSILAGAQQKLTVIVGPIASILVEKAARWAQSPEELYGLLAVHIRDKRERAGFRAASPLSDAAAHDRPAAERRSIAPAEVDRIAGALVAYLGPIGSIIAHRESMAARTIDDLLRRVAARLPSDGDRADFLHALELQGERTAQAA